MEEYPNSSYANAARDALGLPMEEDVRDAVKSLFVEAEADLIERNDPRAAFQKYGNLLEQFPDSQWAPKALYAMGWVCESYLDSLKLAHVLYDSLMARYPQTEYAEAVKAKVKAFNQEIAPPEEENQNSEEAEQAKETAKKEATEKVKDTPLLKKKSQKEHM